MSMSRENVGLGSTFMYLEWDTCLGFLYFILIRLNCLGSAIKSTLSLDDSFSKYEVKTFQITLCLWCFKNKLVLPC